MEEDGGGSFGGLSGVFFAEETFGGLSDDSRRTFRGGRSMAFGGLSEDFRGTFEGLSQEVRMRPSQLNEAFG